MENNWHVARTRYIPAIWPVSVYFDWNYYSNGSHCGDVVHVFNNGNVTAYWKNDNLQELGEYYLNETQSADLVRQRIIGQEAGKRLVSYTKDFAETGEINAQNLLNFFNNLNDLRILKITLNGKDKLFAVKLR